MSGITKSRYWDFVFWPESTPDWKEKLSSLHLSVVVSPLHDRDKLKDGSPAKPHYHAMIQYGNTTTYNHILKLITGKSVDKDGKATGCLEMSVQQVEATKSARGMVRYMTHKDNPEKAQYNEADMTYLGGFDASTIMSDNDQDNEVIRVTAILLENEIQSYREFYRYLLKRGLTAELKIVAKNASHFRAMCQGQRG